ncbi:MAG: hypothetical protein KIT27_09555 [Legionellales bacterium]|nr:hypothetical protein [Legionellales bacterium]
MSKTTKFQKWFGIIDDMLDVIAMYFHQAHQALGNLLRKISQLVSVIGYLRMIFSGFAFVADFLALIHEQRKIRKLRETLKTLTNPTDETEKTKIIAEINSLIVARKKCIERCFLSTSLVVLAAIGFAVIISLNLSVVIASALIFFESMIKFWQLHQQRKTLAAEIQLMIKHETNDDATANEIDRITLNNFYDKLKLKLTTPGIPQHEKTLIENQLKKIETYYEINSTTKSASYLTNAVFSGIVLVLGILVFAGIAATPVGWALVGAASAILVCRSIFYFLVKCAGKVQMSEVAAQTPPHTGSESVEHEKSHPKMSVKQNIQHNDSTPGSSLTDNTLNSGNNISPAKTRSGSSSTVTPPPSTTTNTNNYSAIQNQLAQTQNSEEFSSLAENTSAINASNDISQPEIASPSAIQGSTSTSREYSKDSNITMQTNDNKKNNAINHEHAIQPALTTLTTPADESKRTLQTPSTTSATKSLNKIFMQAVVIASFFCLGAMATQVSARGNLTKVSPEIASRRDTKDSSASLSTVHTPTETSLIDNEVYDPDREEEENNQKATINPPLTNFRGDQENNSMKLSLLMNIPFTQDFPASTSPEPIYDEDALRF